MPPATQCRSDQSAIYDPHATEMRPTGMRPTDIDATDKLVRTFSTRSRAAPSAPPDVRLLAFGPGARLQCRGSHQAGPRANGCCRGEKAPASSTQALRAFGSMRPANGRGLAKVKGWSAGVVVPLASVG